MTIQNREAARRLSDLMACAENALEGTYEQAKAAKEATSEVMDSIWAIFKAHGFKAHGNDRAYELEAHIYDFLRESNPEAYGLITGEGFGSRVISNTIRDRDCLQQLLSQ